MIQTLSAKQTVTQAVTTLPVAVEGYLNVVVKGNTYQNMLSYTPSTWTEWTKSAGVAGDNTGLEFTYNDPNVYAYLPNTKFKGSTKYGMLFNIASNTTSTKYLQLGGELTGLYPNLVIPGQTGNSKYVFTTQAIITTNRVLLIQNNPGDIGLKVKLRDIRFFELPTGSQIETDFTNMTADQLALKYIWHSGLCSTPTQKVKSIGKNLFDGQLESGYISSTTGGNTVLGTAVRSTNYIKVTPSTAYTLKRQDGINGMGIFYYNDNNVFINAYVDGSVQQFAITTPANCTKVRFGILSQTAISTQVQFEKGTTATVYEPYTETVVTTPLELRSVGTVKDEFGNDGVYIKRNSLKTLQSSDVMGMVTVYTNLDFAYISKPTDFVGYNNTNLGGYVLEGYPELSIADSTGNIGTSNTNAQALYIRIGFAKGTTLATAQAALNGKKLIYQLTTPITMDNSWTYLTLQNADIVSIDTNDSALDWAKINKPSDFIEYDMSGSGLGKCMLENYPEYAYSNNAKNIGTLTAEFRTGFYVGFAKGTSLATAQAALNGKKLYYKLANTTSNVFPTKAIQNKSSGILTTEAYPLVDSTIPTIEYRYPVSSYGDDYVDMFGTATVTSDSKIISVMYDSANINCSATVTSNAFKYKVLMSGLPNKKGEFFKFNGRLHYLQDGKYTVFDGTTATAIVPYIPTVIINRTPTGGGNTNEQYNRLGKGFINSFNSDGTSTIYTLTDTVLDATPLVASIDYGVTWDRVENTHFTVNRTTGVVTWVTAPPSGQNRTKIKAYKTIQADIDSILKCTHVIPFGGQNDNRVFFGGNGTGYYYWSGISTAGIDSTYFPWNNYNIIGNPDENITGFGKQYGTLCIFKPREIYGVTYSWNGTTGVFNTFSVNPHIGCDCPDTIQAINNSLVWLNTYNGVYILVGTPVESQRNVFPISRNINPRLMSESNLSSATSIDYNGKYWLCVNDKVYLWDYFISPYVDTGNPEESAKRLSWWYFDSINASCFILNDQKLYYCSRSEGAITQFHRENDNKQFYDFGSGINAIYRIPLRDLGDGLYEFDVIDMWIDCRGDTNSSIKAQYVTSDDLNGDPLTDEIELNSFTLENFSLDNFTLDVNGFKETFSLSPMEKKIDLFGVELSGNTPGRDMNISNVAYSYRLGKKK